MDAFEEKINILAKYSLDDALRKLREDSSKTIHLSSVDGTMIKGRIDDLEYQLGLADDRYDRLVEVCNGVLKKTPNARLRLAVFLNKSWETQVGEIE